MAHGSRGPGVITGGAPWLPWKDRWDLAHPGLSWVLSEPPPGTVWVAQRGHAGRGPAGAAERSVTTWPCCWDSPVSPRCPYPGAAAVSWGGEAYADSS